MDAIGRVVLVTTLASVSLLLYRALGRPLRAIGERTGASVYSVATVRRRNADTVGEKIGTDAPNVRTGGFLVEEKQRSRILACGDTFGGTLQDTAVGQEEREDFEPGTEARSKLQADSSAITAAERSADATGERPGGRWDCRR